MDPADHAVANQAALLGQHDQLLRTLMENSAVMTYTVAELTQQVTGVTRAALPQAPTATRAGVRDFHACDPEPFKGDLDKCRGFLLQCRLVFEMCPLFFITLLR